MILDFEFFTELFENRKGLDFFGFFKSMYINKFGTKDSSFFKLSFGIKFAYIHIFPGYQKTPFFSRKHDVQIPGQIWLLQNPRMVFNYGPIADAPY